MSEVWKDVPGYEGMYQASSLGNVRSVTRKVNSKGGCPAIKKGKVLKQTLKKKGYLCVNLSSHGKSKAIEVQRVIALTFIPNPTNLPCVNHIDENPQNNNVSNLEWCTYKYNNEYGSRKEKDHESRINGKCSKPVEQYNLSGEKIAEYPSIAEVKRQLGYDPGKISACALNKPHRGTAYGYVWKFKNTNRNNA